jgi:hypothetical protein
MLIKKNKTRAALIALLALSSAAAWAKPCYASP